jgi:hypothetical protein
MIHERPWEFSRNLCFQEVAVFGNTVETHNCSSTPGQ